MLKVIESESSAWTIIAEEGELHIYAREGEGEWSEVALSEDSEQIDGDMSALLEELYVREHDGQEPRGETDEEDFEQEDEGSDEDEDEDEAPEASEEPEDEEPAERPRRRRSKTAARR